MSTATAARARFGTHDITITSPEMGELLDRSYAWYSENEKMRKMVAMRQEGGLYELVGDSPTRRLAWSFRSLFRPKRST